MADKPSSPSVCEFGRWRVEQSQEGIPLVFGDGKYPQDPPRVASQLESALSAEVKRLRSVMERWEQRFDRWQDWRIFEALDEVNETRESRGAS